MSSISATSSTKATSVTSANQASAASGPKQGLEKKAGDILTERYTISVDKGRITILDRKTKTHIKITGDMNISTKDGDRVRVENGNTTIDLKDGTRVTLVPTADGTGIDKVAIVKDREGIVYNNVHEGPTSKGIRRGADRIDARFDDGTTLVAGHQIDDIFQNGVGQLKGNVTIAGATSAPPPTQEAPAAPAPAPEAPPPSGTAPPPPGGAGGTEGTGNTPGTNKPDGTSDTSNGKQSDIAKTVEEKLATLHPDRIDEDFEWMWGKLKSGKLSEEDRIAIQKLMSDLQAFAQLISAFNKARADTQRSIIQNF